MIFRDARRDEVPRIVALLADDELGAGRETGVDDAYLGAFDDIAADPRSRLIVADVDGQVAGTLQLTVLPGLSRHGMRRAQIEGAAGRRRRIPLAVDIPMRRRWGAGITPTRAN